MGSELKRNDGSHKFNPLWQTAFSVLAGELAIYSPFQPLGSIIFLVPRPKVHIAKNDIYINELDQQTFWQLEGIKDHSISNLLPEVEGCISTLAAEGQKRKKTLLSDNALELFTFINVHFWEKTHIFFA